VTVEESDDLEVLLHHLRENRGFDFTGYKRASLGRRIRKRMADLGVDSFAEYRDLLEAQPDEFGALFDTILINVTSFFRDPELWDYVGATVLPRILEAKSDGRIRVWSAGCASGEEAYSLAILMCDAVGEERFRSEVKVYGTDADNAALTTARHARYPRRGVEGVVSPEHLDRYFERVDDDYVFRGDLRRSVIFGRHDLVMDPPISRVDLLSCRNTLMYFNAETQRRVLSSFHFALAPGGYLLLGKAEALVTRTNMFRTDDPKRHVFQRDGVSRVPRLLPPTPAPTPLTSGDRLMMASFDGSPIPHLIISGDGRLEFANRQARTLFAIGLSQVGRPLKDLEVSYRPVELRSRLDEVLSGRRAVTITDVEHTLPSGSTEYFDVQLLPLGQEGTGTAGISVLFTPTSRYKHLRDEAERFQRELESTYEELQSTNEELETTNEELQSTNEELETTNEELHSTNEELETMNEELQSTNEELETMNDELRERSIELDGLSSFLQMILGSLTSAVVVLNQSMAVLVWNLPAEELWGLRADEVEGSHFLNLDIGIAVDELAPPIRAVLNGSANDEQRELDAVDRRGRKFRCVVTIKPLQPAGERPDGVIIMMDRQPE
jgi:two-component system CheB/CheR fusion protein